MNTQPVQPITVGLASFGMSGRIFHAPFIERNPIFKLKLILERTKTVSKKKYPNARIVTTFEALLNDKEIELIIINTPSYLHYEMTKSALLAGKHVVVEKPFTVTSKEGRELIQLAETNHLILTVYHNKRLEGGFKTVKNLLDSNRLGKLKNVRLAIPRYKPFIGPKAWKENKYPGAGLLYDLGSHLIDQSLQLFGQPLHITADLQIQRNQGKVIDYFVLYLKYEDFDVELATDMFSKNPGPTFSLTGAKASFVKYGNDLQEQQLDEDLIDWDQLGKDTPPHYGRLTNIKTSKEEIVKTEAGSYADFYQNLYGAIRLNIPLLITPEEALEVIELIEKSLSFEVVNNTLN